MADEHVGALIPKPLVILEPDARVSLAHKLIPVSGRISALLPLALNLLKPFAPALPARSVLIPRRRGIGHPPLAPKHSAQSGDSHAGDLDHPTIGVAVREIRHEQVLMPLRNIRIVLARYPPGLDSEPRERQNFEVQRHAQVMVSKQHDRFGALGPAGRAARPWAGRTANRPSSPAASSQLARVIASNRASLQAFAPLPFSRKAQHGGSVARVTIRKPSHAAGLRSPEPFAMAAAPPRGRGGT